MKLLSPAWLTAPPHAATGIVPAQRQQQPVLLTAVPGAGIMYARDPNQLFPARRTAQSAVTGSVPEVKHSHPARLTVQSAEIMSALKREAKIQAVALQIVITVVMESADLAKIVQGLPPVRRIAIMRAALQGYGNGS